MGKMGARSIFWRVCTAMAVLSLGLTSADEARASFSLYYCARADYAVLQNPSTVSQGSLSDWILFRFAPQVADSGPSSFQLPASDRFGKLLSLECEPRAVRFWIQASDGALWQQLYKVEAGKVGLGPREKLSQAAAAAGVVSELSSASEVRLSGGAQRSYWIRFSEESRKEMSHRSWKVIAKGSKNEVLKDWMIWSASFEESVD